MRSAALGIVDVFAYLVVIGIFTQFFPKVIAESFLVMLLTAVLLKVVLEVVLVGKKQVLKRVRTAERPIVRVGFAVGLVAVMASSKFVVIELTALLFGDSVKLGGFFQVTVLIVSLIATRAGLRACVVRLDHQTAAFSGAPHE